MSSVRMNVNTVPSFEHSIEERVGYISKQWSKALFSHVYIPVLFG